MIYKCNSDPKPQPYNFLSNTQCNSSSKKSSHKKPTNGPVGYWGEKFG